MLRRGKTPVLHRRHIGLHRLVYRTRALHEILHEARLAAGEDADHVVQHQHLTIAASARANADGCCRG